MYIFMNTEIHMDRATKYCAGPFKIKELRKTILTKVSDIQSDPSFLFKENENILDFSVANLRAECHSSNIFPLQKL